MVSRAPIPKASGKSSIAQMLAQKSQAPVAPVPPQPPQLNGMRAPPPPAMAPAPPMAVSGANPQAVVTPQMKAMMLARMFGAGGPSAGGGMGSMVGGAPPIAR